MKKLLTCLLTYGRACSRSAEQMQASFRYRKSLYKVERIWSGMMECSQTVALAYKVTTNLNQTQLKTISDIIDRMLVLLMGDIIRQ